jgi:hypothetical protein
MFDIENEGIRLYTPEIGKAASYPLQEDVLKEAF